MILTGLLGQLAACALAVPLKASVSTAADSRPSARKTVLVMRELLDTRLGAQYRRAMKPAHSHIAGQLLSQRIGCRTVSSGRAAARALALVLVGVEGLGRRRARAIGFDADHLVGQCIFLEAVGLFAVRLALGVQQILALLVSGLVHGNVFQFQRKTMNSNTSTMPGTPRSQANAYLPMMSVSKLKG